MPHANAKLTERGRLELARLVVEGGWTIAAAAERWNCTYTTAQRWVSRYRAEGPAGMVDRSSRPRRCPRQTPPRVERKIVHLRVKRGLGPARIGWALGVPASTVHRVLTRRGLARLADMDRATRRVVRRYERERPGELVHIDIKKLANIPAGGGHRVRGVVAGRANSRAETSSGRRTRNGDPWRGYSYLHTAVDDHSRFAYTEIHPDETAATAVDFLDRAHAHFTTLGLTVAEILTDNGSCYTSRAWASALADRGVKRRRTRPYRPQTNGKVERFNRTLLTEWAYAKPYRSESARRNALPAWLHTYNHHRPHTALGGQPPASRIPNLSGQNT